MKEIVLKRIELTNFKGQAHRIEEFAPGENFIFGENGTGKTSVLMLSFGCFLEKIPKGRARKKQRSKCSIKVGIQFGILTIVWRQPC